MPLAIVALAVCTWPSPFLRPIGQYGFLIGVLSAALLGFYFIKKAKGTAVPDAVIGALLIVITVFALSMILIVNTVGD